MPAPALPQWQTSGYACGMNMQTWAIDIGGSGVKGIVLDAAGVPVGDRKRIRTPQPATPTAVLETVRALDPGQANYDRVSVGFPGVVVEGTVASAVNLGPGWDGFDVATALEELLNKPVRVANDADVAGFSAIDGHGVELVVTLGTGFGSALFVDGVLVPNLELGHHPFRNKRTYEELLGQGRSESGRKKEVEPALAPGRRPTATPVQLPHAHVGRRQRPQDRRRPAPPRASWRQHGGALGGDCALARPRSTSSGIGPSGRRVDVEVSQHGARQVERACHHQGGSVSHGLLKGATPGLFPPVARLG